MPFVFKAERDEPRPNPIPLTPQEQEVQRILRTANNGLQDAATSNAVTNAIAGRNIERVVEAFPWDQTAETINKTAATFGEVVRGNIGDGFPSVSFRGRFDYTDPRTLDFAKNQAAQLVTAVSDETRKMIRTTIARSFNEGITVKQTARNLRGLIGLNDRQATTYGKFQQQIQARIDAKEINSMQGYKMLEKRYKEMIKYRADMIARQEILMAENAGRYLGFTQSIEQGWASKKSVKRWSTSTDERTCDICMPMNGKSVQWDQSFPNGVFNPPAHIMCRCSISLLEPDSSLAQSFMEPAPIAPPTKNLPLPNLPTISVGNLRTPQEAVITSSENSSGLSTFQYDAGQIEGLNVAVEQVISNGIPSTEIRFKLTSKAKQELAQSIERTVAQGLPTYKKSNGILVIDRKVGKKLDFEDISEDEFVREQMERALNNGYNTAPAYMDTVAGSNTYTRIMPNGTAIRFVTSKESYSYDGLVRIIIPGKATPEQIKSVMKELGVKANRLPTVEDIEALKEARIISLFLPRAGDYLKLTPAFKKTFIDDITDRFKFTMDEVVTEIDADGALRFKLPDRVAKKILTDANVESFQHSLGGLLTGLPQADKTSIIVNLFTSNTKLLSNTQRRVRGVNGQGISELEDVRTGGADYVFLRPSRDSLDTVPRFSNNLVFNPQPLTARGDWFAYSSDSYGVKNPNFFQTYLNTKNKTRRLDELDYLEELTNPSHRAEIMFPESVSLKDLVAITLDPVTRDEVLVSLRGLGITDWNGRKIEDVIILPLEHR